MCKNEKKGQTQSFIVLYICEDREGQNVRKRGEKIRAEGRNPAHMCMCKYANIHVNKYCKHVCGLREICNAVYFPICFLIKQAQKTLPVGPGGDTV